MKLLLVCAAAIAVASVGACTPAGGAAAVSLVGKWQGTITCYSIESPLQMTIDAATPKQAAMGKGDGGALSWTASVAFDEATRAVTLKADGPTDGADTLAGPLSADGGSFGGKMDKQLCTDFKLTRQS